MVNKHTPWEVEGGFVYSGDNQVCEMLGSDEEAIPNSRMISAAPEMYDLIKHLVDHCEPLAFDLIFGAGIAAEMRRLVNKATGETQ